MRLLSFGIYLLHKISLLLIFFINLRTLLVFLLIWTLSLFYFHLILFNHLVFVLFVILIFFTTNFASILVFLCYRGWILIIFIIYLGRYIWIIFLLFFIRWGRFKLLWRSFNLKYFGFIFIQIFLQLLVILGPNFWMSR